MRKTKNFNSQDTVVRTIVQIVEKLVCPRGRIRTLLSLVVLIDDPKLGAPPTLFSYYFKMISQFEKLVQNFKLKRVGGAPKDRQLTPLSRPSRLELCRQYTQQSSIYTCMHAMTKLNKP